MPHRVCPWWIGYLLASPLRRLTSDPAGMLSSYVQPGMTVLEPGPGMGFFTLELSRLVAPSGHVIAVDIQPRMLEALRRRAGKAGVLERIDIRLAKPDSLGISDLHGTVDFVLAHAVVHEMPSARTFFLEAAEALKPGASLLLAEPAGHVKTAEFEAELKEAADAGLSLAGRPDMRRSQAALFRKLA